jgi:hypothetical protein
VGETKESAWMLTLQYASNEIRILEEELRAVDALFLILYEMENAKMLVVESSAHAKLFQQYKGALVKIRNIRKKEQRRNRKLLESK